jgi:hypothetical protein
MTRMSIAFDGTRVPTELPRMNCGGIPIFDMESGYAYRCDRCFAVIGSMGQSEKCKTMNAAAAIPPEEIIKSLEDEVADLRARKDGAYSERNELVAALATLFPSGTRKTNIEGWSDDWHNCVFIDLPTGQVSWHYHDSEVHLFEHLPPYEKPWDGHTTEEKYKRLAALKDIKCAQ